MAGLSVWHVVIFAIVVILLFGTTKLKNLGKDIGGAVKDFKKSIREDDVSTQNQLEHPKPTQIDVNHIDTSIKS
ncbi:twin-arginine translocase subunit TatA [Acinetobacter sp. ANC 4558]|uniref:twin-arginine translocase TatA/TatE family subunit n=1 Tax=Acinetobacter sp. ANC 4558 TaxID=1977876 RepID=UPI000A33A19F|nr:twin-arginine translocase TatA/TatE family subunit [Acinetobacter sp. ANC 4558]OTG85595.1 twin-arginine translocase subunit TatA [Acinetobacter sp. ANC 4558]